MAPAPQDRGAANLGRARTVYSDITLAEARRKALDNSRAVRHGGDPRGRGVPTFAEAAERTIELHRDG